MIRLRCGCKLNLGLRIDSVRPDGFHNLNSIFYPLPFPCDDLLIDIRTVGGVLIETQPPILSQNQNILQKTCSLFAAAGGAVPHMHIVLHKRIPIGAGLGGGSSNAGRLLSWLNSVSASPLSPEDLVRVAQEIGADVPFFLINRPCRLMGRGAELTPLSLASPAPFVVLVWPDIKIDTGRAFAAYDSMGGGEQDIFGERHPEENILTKHGAAAKNFVPCENGRTCPDMPLYFHNDLEVPVFRNYPQLQELKKIFIRHGARAAAMSGSGSAIYGLFDDPCAARSLVHGLRKDHRHVYLVPLGQNRH